MKTFLHILFFLAIFLAGLIATETRLLLFWPACLLLGAGAFLGVFQWRSKIRGNPSALCLLSALLFGGYMLARACTSPVVYLAREDWIPLIAALIVYGTLALRVVETKQRRWLLWTLLLLTLGNLLVGIIHYKGNPEFHILPFLSRNFEPGRIGGFFNNPNHLGAFLESVVLFALGWLCFGRTSVTVRFVVGFLVLMACFGIGLTISRGAMIGTASGLLALILLGLWLVRIMHPFQFGKVMLASFVLLLLGAGVMMIVNGDSLKQRFGNKMLAISNEDMRPLFWTSAIKQNGENPAFGTGARTFLHKSRQYRDENLPSWTGDPEFAHSEYMQMLADYGWVGLALLALMVTCHFWNAVVFMGNYARRYRDEGGRMTGHALGFAVGATIALIALLLHAAGEFHFHVPIVCILGAALFGILANPGSENFSDTRFHKLSFLAPFLIKTAVFLAGSVLIFASARYGRADMYVQQAENLENEDALGLKQTYKLNLGRDLDPANFTVFDRLAAARYALMGAAKNEQLGANQRIRAVADLKEAVRLYPDNIFLLIRLGRAQTLALQAADADQTFKRAMQIAPRYQNIRLAYAFSLNTQGRWAEAEEYFLESWFGKYNGRVISPNNWVEQYFDMLRRARLEATPLPGTSAASLTQ